MRWGILLCLTAGLAACTGNPGSRVDSGALEIKVLSNRADLISGGDALVEVVLPRSAAADALHVDVDGRDVSSAFKKRSDGRVVGLVAGLKDGANVVTAKVGKSGARLTITNYPIGGPIFSGAQVQPWVCATPTAQEATSTSAATNASGLSSAATDTQCNIPSEDRLFYRTTEQCSQGRQGPPCFKPYDPNAPMPADVAETTNDQGVKTKFIVRVERGVMNRAIYDMAVLFDPASAAADGGLAAWNRKLLWSFGGGSGTPHKQFAPNSPWQIDYALARGYLVAVSAHTDQALNSNHVVAAETVMMGKEHVIERYGEIKYTIGTGCSGGSIMQLQLASLYPGLLDGIQPSCTYPDSYSTSTEVGDCVLLGNYFASAEFAALTKELTPAQVAAKKAAIAGHMDDKACPNWAMSFGSSNNPGVYTNPRTKKPMNNCFLLDSQVYDAAKNPNGVRCTIPEYALSTWGATPGTHVARRTNDNAGIQYGLKALAAGQIGAEEFVALNEKIGGTDNDMNLTAARMVADPEALRIAYQDGIIGDAKQWAKVPIIDWRGNDNSNIHMNWRAFAVRDRLDRINGGHGNQVIWRYGPGLLPPPQLMVDSLVTIDKWVAAIKADTSTATLEEKVVKNKPAEAFDFCYIGNDYTTKVTDWAKCDADPVLRYFASPRQVAGGPLAEDVLKCQLKPLKRSDYATKFSDEQWARLSKVFASGVCDWSKAGVGMQRSTPWRTFAKGPGGVPMGEAPRSKKI
ncbi:MAG TPA: DUF6351 family protein [Steroidobacteraceae bacterium]|nr:DUF6351 family protein [Steroidobacteraceae bacterium]